MGPVIYVMLAIIAISVALVSITYFRKRARYLNRIPELNNQTTTSIEIEEEIRPTGRCDICLDDLGKEAVSVCPCGKTFHTSCAEPTEYCPYCNSHFETFMHHPSK